MAYESMFGEDGLSLEKIRILGLLERDGLTSEVLEVVTKWTLEMQTRSLISSKEMIRFNVDRAELYEAVGDIDGMFESLDHALYQVRQEKDAGVEIGNWEELLQKIEARIKEMEAKYPA